MAIQYIIMQWGTLTSWVRFYSFIHSMSVRLCIEDLDIVVKYDFNIEMSTVSINMYH